MSVWSQIGNFFKNIGRTIASPFNKLLGTGTTQAQYEQNQWQSQEAALNRAFQSNEAALQRNWSSQEAERARDWQEEMYEKYNSLSGKIAQAEQAGVNPMIAITGDAASPMSTNSSAPSGAAATGGSMPSSSLSPSESFVNLIGQLLGAKKIDSEIAVNESIANRNNADAEGIKINNETLNQMNVAEILSKLSDVEMNNANIELVAAKILNTNADTEVKGAHLGLVLAQIRNTDADTAVKQKQIGVLTSEILKNTKSLEVMDAQITQMLSSAGLSDVKAAESAQLLKNLVQQYGHNEVMNEFSELIAKNDADMSKFFSVNDENDPEIVKSIKRFYHIIEGIVDFSAGVGFN